MLSVYRNSLKASTSKILRRSFCAAADTQVHRPEPCQAASLLDIGTRAIFTSEHDMFRETARKFFVDQVKPYHSQWEKDGQVSRDCWLKAGEVGILGAQTSDKYGGIGCDRLYSAIVWEEQGYSLCTGPGFALHSDIVMPYIENYGTEEQKQRYLGKMTRGEWIGAIAMTEPCAGSDLAGIKTIATKNGDGTYSLSGSKVFITNGAMADVVIVVAKTDPEKGPHGISLFIVEEGMKGFSRGKKLQKMGMKAQDTSELFFDKVILGEEHLLGGLNKGFYYLMQELPQERLLIADMGLAAAEACFEITRSYTKERKAFKKSISEFQLVRHKLADIKTRLTASRSFIDMCISLHAKHKLDSATASMAKSQATDLQFTSIDECVQLHGGWGYMWEYDVCRALVDGRVQRIYGGTNEIMMELVARSI